MRKWTAERAFEVIHKVSKQTAPNPTAKQIEIMRQKFVQITVFGELKFSNENFQIWEDNLGNLAYTDRVWRECCVVNAGLRYVINDEYEIDEG